MNEPFWRELIRQDVLEQQYAALRGSGKFTDKEIAIHLARFAEARMFNAADRRIAEIEQARRQANEPPTQ